MWGSSVFDLCDDHGAQIMLRSMRGEHGTPEVGGYCAVQCHSAEDMLLLIEKGHRVRMIRHTKMSTATSRSVVALIVKISSTSKTTLSSWTGKLMMCDMAGSETVHRTGVHGSPLAESVHLHRCVTSLGHVVSAINKGAKFVPWRDSPLTFLLRDVWVRIIVIITCSPALTNAVETVFSLSFGAHVKLTGADLKAAARSS